MKKYLLGILFFVIIIPVYGQNQEDNLTKYWRYRDRLRNRFIVVDEHVERFGVNIPAVSIDYDNNIINWGDANSNMSHYLSVLATELWLLKNNNQDYSTTLKELYYAMMAMERLDTYSEYLLRWKENIGYWFQGYWIRGFTDEGHDINGFHIRDDVSQDFFEYYKNHFDVSKFSSVFNDNNMQEISQDNIYHNLEGLALVSKFVGNESVSGIPTTFVNTIISDRLVDLGIQNGSTINFSLWAKDFTKRYIKYIQSCGTYSVTFAGTGLISTHWILANPITLSLVKEGSGSDFDMGAFYHHGVIKTGQAITGENLRIYEGLISPPEGIYDDLFRKHAIKVDLPVDPITNLIVDELFGGIWVDISFDDYKLRSLSCNGNVLGNETFSILRNHRDNYNPNNTGHFPIYEHFPLLYLTLHDPNYDIMAFNDDVYKADKVLYENLLNSAPTCGTISNGVYDWSSVSRCVWPEQLGKHPSDKVEYSGLDYMMLHNLYYMSFRKEDFKNLTITEAYNNQTITKYAKTIEASNSISGGNVTYTASNKIFLKQGFRASNGATFKSYISSRPNNYQGDLYKTISVSDCKNTLKSTKVPKKVGTSDLFEPTKIKRDENSIENIPQLNISFFPNPNKGILNVTTINTLLPLDFDIVSIKSVVVYKGSITASNQQFDISKLSSGMYLIRFYAKDKIYTEKLSIIY